jgi:hypothetical protein
LLEHTKIPPTQQWYRQKTQERITERNKTNKGQHAEKTKEKWQRKGMHGQFPRTLDEKLVNNEQPY